MQTRSCDENSVRPSVCLSVRLSGCQTRALWQNGRKLCLDFYITRKNIYPTFLRRRMVGGGDPFYLKFWVNRPTLERNRRFEPIIACSASAVRPSEKSSINTNRKSHTRFQTSLRWSSYVGPKSPKGGSITQNGRFPSKLALLLKKFCYKVSLCENCQRQSCRVFIGLTIHAKIIGGVRPLLPEILGQSDRVGVKSQIFDLFSVVALNKFPSVKTVSDRVVRHSLYYPCKND